jgi:hypothetical protein
MNPRSIRFEFADPGGAITDSRLPEWKHFDRVVESTDPNCEWSKNRNFNKRVRVYRESEHYYENNNEVINTTDERKNNNPYYKPKQSTPVTQMNSYASMVTPNTGNNTPPPGNNIIPSTTFQSPSENTSYKSENTNNTEVSTISNTNNEMEQLKEKIEFLNTTVNTMETKMHTITTKAVDAMGEKFHKINQESMQEVQAKIENSKIEIRIELKQEINAKSDENTDLILNKLKELTISMNNSTIDTKQRFEEIQEKFEKN